MNQHILPLHVVAHPLSTSIYKALPLPRHSSPLPCPPLLPTFHPTNYFYLYIPAAILLPPAPAALLRTPPVTAGVNMKPSTQGASKQATTKATSTSMATLAPLLMGANGMMIDDRQGKWRMGRLAG
jgi:hypothetical protein